MTKRLSEEELRVANERYYKRLQDNVDELAERWNKTSHGEQPEEMQKQILVPLYVVERLLTAWRSYGYDWDRRQGWLAEAKRDGNFVLFLTSAVLMGSVVGDLSAHYLWRVPVVIGVVLFFWAIAIGIRVWVQRGLDRELGKPIKLQESED